MRMFAVIFVVLACASIFAWRIQPRPRDDGKTPLIWVSDDNPARRGNVELFNKLHPDLELRLDPNNGGMEKVIVQSLAGVGPDLFDCWGPQQLAAYVKADIAWDVTEELARAGIDLKSEVWETVLPNVVYEGRVYGFPANASADALWFNKQVFDDAGVAYPKGPWTWEQFLPLAQRMTVRDTQGRTKVFGFSVDPYMWKFFLCQWGGRIYSADGTRCTLDTPEAVAAVRFMHDLIYKYGVMPSPGDEDAMSQEGGWGSPSMKMIGSGRLAMSISGRWWLCTLRNYKDLRLGAVQSPRGPTVSLLGGGRGTLINRNSPRRNQALEYLKYMSGEFFNRLVNQQADALAPMKRFCTDEMLFNPHFPREDFHGVFRDIMPSAQPEQISPFVNANLAEGIISKQMDLVRRDAKSPEDAMRTAAKQVNEEIERSLRRDPTLKRRFEQFTGAAAARAEKRS